MDEHQIHVFPINHKYCRHEAGKEGERKQKGEEKKAGKDKREEEKQKD